MGHTGMYWLQDLERMKVAGTLQVAFLSGGRASSAGRRTGLGLRGRIREYDHWLTGSKGPQRPRSISRRRGAAVVCWRGT